MEWYDHSRKTQLKDLAANTERFLKIVFLDTGLVCVFQSFRRSSVGTFCHEKRNRVFFVESKNSLDFVRIGFEKIGWHLSEHFKGMKFKCSGKMPP